MAHSRYASGNAATYASSRSLSEGPSIPDMYIAQLPALWKPARAAKYLGMSVRWLRNSSVPKVLVPGAGRRPSIRYAPEEVAAWARRHLTHSVRGTRT